MHEIFLLVQNSVMEVESFIKKYWKNDMKGNGGIFYCNYWAIINDVSTFATAQKMKFSMKDFFNKFDQICRLKKALMEIFIFVQCAQLIAFLFEDT